MQILLQTWPKLESEQALELLDYTFADQAVRRIAVECIEKMSDREISQYLLQLVQVLKYESYLDCELAEFLLRRALNNQHFGHALYWLLRAEMENPEVSVRFGLMLEAYCRGAPAHMKSLQRQAQALSKMKSVTELLQLIDRDRRERGLAAMKELLRQKTYQGALSKLSSPLDPSFKLRNLKLVFFLRVLLVSSFPHGPVLVASASDESQQEFKKNAGKCVPKFEALTSSVSLFLLPIA